MIASLCILILACIYIYFFPFIPKRKKHYTYALLLGCPAHDDGTMSSSQIKRCDLAIKAYQQNLYDTLIISGSNVKNEFIEAKVMHAYIQNKMDIPTILETNARNTFENFKFSKDIITSSLRSEDSLHFVPLIIFYFLKYSKTTIIIIITIRQIKMEKVPRKLKINEYFFKT